MAMQFAVEVLRKDQAAVDFYTAKYKPFRLQALLTDPSYFGSTYAREAAFTNEQWGLRVLNPAATVVLAISGEGDSRQVLSSATLVELPVPPGLFGVPDSVHCSNSESAPLHWAVHGVYTAPAARRLGILTEVMAAATRDVLAKAAALGRDCLLTVIVAKDNVGGRAAYEKCGFVFSSEEEEPGMGPVVRLVRFLPRGGNDVGRDISQ